MEHKTTFSEWAAVKAARINSESEVSLYMLVICTSDYSEQSSFRNRQQRTFKTSAAELHALPALQIPACSSVLLSR